MKAFKNYLIVDRWEMLDLLDWAEKFEKMPIEEHHLLGTQGFTQDIGFNAIQASRELWAFLNLSLVGTARSKFDKSHVSMALTCGAGLSAQWRPIA